MLFFMLFLFKKLLKKKKKTCILIHHITCIFKNWLLPYKYNVWLVEYFQNTKLQKTHLSRHLISWWAQLTTVGMKRWSLCLDCKMNQSFKGGKIIANEMSCLSDAQGRKGKFCGREVIRTCDLRGHCSPVGTLPIPLAHDFVSTFQRLALKTQREVESLDPRVYQLS